MKLETHLTFYDGPDAESANKAPLILEGKDEKEILEKLIRYFGVVFSVYKTKTHDT